METLVIKTARATNPYVQPEMKFRSPPGQFHHEPPLAANLLFINTVGPPSQAWDPDPYVKTWLGIGRRAAHSTSGMARQKPKEDNYYEPLWKAFE